MNVFRGIRYVINGPEEEQVAPAERRRRANRAISAALADVDDRLARAQATADEAHRAAIAARRAGNNSSALAHMQVKQGQMQIIATYTNARKRLLAQRSLQERQEASTVLAAAMREVNAGSVGFPDTVDDLEEAIGDQTDTEHDLSRADALLEGDPLDEAAVADIFADLDREIEADLSATLLSAHLPAPVAAEEDGGFRLPPNPVRAGRGRGK